MTLYPRFAAHIADALATLEREGDLPAGLSTAAVTVEPPRDASHGDLATNAAMVLAKPAGMKPRDIATQLALKLARLPDVAEAEVAGPGFLNLRLKPDVWRAELAAIKAAGADYGRSALGAGKTDQRRICLGQPHRPDAHGPLPGRGGGRCAWPGCWPLPASRSPANITSTTPAARSIRSPARRICATGRRSAPPSRFRKASTPAITSSPSAKRWRRNSATGSSTRPKADWLVLFRTRAVALMMDRIRADLALLGIHQDVYFSEASLGPRVQEALDTLTAKGLIYEGVLEAPKGEAA